MSFGRIGSYELLESLGQGGMSVVFKARDSRLGRVVALKVLPAQFTNDPERRARLMREARAGAALSHSAIATCFEVGEGVVDPPDLLAPGTPGPHPARALYLSMEYVPGTDLAQLLGERPLPVARVLQVGIQIAAALETAHSAGVIHRDLKPSNVRVTPDGNVKILDFGLAHVLRTSPAAGATPSDLTSEGRILGTAYHMAPEQAGGGAVDARSDLFALGTLLYQLVTGHLPFVGATYLEVLYAVANQAPPPLARYAANVPDELERIVRKLHEKDPARRYQSAHEVRTDLERLAERGVRPRWREWVPVSKRALWAIAATLVALAVIASADWLLREPHPGRSVAVMPLLNRTGDAGLDYLGEGVANDVMGDLVRRSKLNVASFSSVLSLGSQTRSARSVAHELGVGAVVEGSLRRAGGSTIVDVELVNGRTGVVLWTERYDYTRAGAFEIVDGIVLNVARQLSGRAPTGLRGAATRSHAAYDLYLRAGALLEDPDDPQGPDKALALYGQALVLDPDFALAWAGQSRAQVRIWKRDKDPESLRRAEEAADHAVTLNANLIEARVARAQVYRATSRSAEAIRELLAVRALNPDWDEADLQLAVGYRDAGDLIQAEASLRHAAALRPDYWRIWNSLAAVLTRRGDYEGALEASRRIIRLVPEKNRGYEQLAAIEATRGDYADAIAVYRRLPGPVRDGTLASNIATAYFIERRLAEARRYYQLAVDFEPRNATWRMNLGDWHVRAGHADSAYAQFTEASRLLGEQLQVDPKNPGLWLDRSLCRAKLGDCPGAETTLTRISAALPDSDADAAHMVARIEALCGPRVRALDALSRALALGAPARVIGAEDEFQSLDGDPRFKALLKRKR